ncbi:MAG: hypothetical protein PARBA_01530 [Parabacteroides sp.]
MRDNTLSKSLNVTEKKSGPIQWIALIGLAGMMSSEYQHHDYNLVGLIFFPVLIFLLSLGVQKNIYARLTLVIIVSLISFCFYGEKTIIHFFIPFISGFGSLLIYLFISKQLK